MDTVTTHYFVDEAGHPDLFFPGGRVKAGTEGCSRFFLIGKLDVSDPPALSVAMESLRADLMADPYFKRVPSMQPDRGKTALYFHAKDDLAEVRREVFKLILSHDVGYYAVVRDKLALAKDEIRRKAADPGYRYKSDFLYDSLVTELFGKPRPTADVMHISFAKRGRKNRTGALMRALELANQRFEQNYGFVRKTEFRIFADSPVESGGLQAVDYLLWAVQRFYERGEDRYVELVWPKVKEIHDLDAAGGGAFFRQGKKLTRQTRLIEGI